MAIERLFQSMGQDLMVEASGAMEEGSRLARQGKGEEAEAKLREAAEIFTKVRSLRELTPTVLERLREIGAKEPSVDYLRRLIPLIERLPAVAVEEIVPALPEERELPPPATAEEMPPVEDVTGFTAKERFLYERLREATLTNNPLFKSGTARILFPEILDVDISLPRASSIQTRLKKKLARFGLTIADVTSPEEEMAGAEASFMITKSEPRQTEGQAASEGQEIMAEEDLSQDQELPADI